MEPSGTWKTFVQIQNIGPTKVLQTQMYLRGSQGTMKKKKFFLQHVIIHPFSLPLFPFLCPCLCLYPTVCWIILIGRKEKKNQYMANLCTKNQLLLYPSMDSASVSIKKKKCLPHIHRFPSSCFNAWKFQCFRFLPCKYTHTHFAYDLPMTYFSNDGEWLMVHMYSYSYLPYPLNLWFRLSTWVINRS